MKFLQHLFKSRDVLDPLRKAIKQQSWAEALSIGAEIPRSNLEQDRLNELEEMLHSAGDGLARLNLSEGEAFFRAGEGGKAQEHLELASAQACSAELKREIQQLLDQVGKSLSSEWQSPEPQNDACGCSSGCQSGCAEASETDPLEFSSPGPRQDMLGEEDRFELILAGYPPDLHPTYQGMGESLRRAFLLAHDERMDEALLAFEEVPKGQRGEPFFFERGNLLARVGRPERARDDLLQISLDSPFYTHSLDLLIQMDLGSGDHDAAEKKVRDFLAKGGPEGFCHFHLTKVAMKREQLEPALEHAMTAIQNGYPHPDLLVFAASVLEKKGRLEETENLLGQLPSGGCSGKNLPLAEFWTRHGKNPDASLDAFKAALRSEPGNPRWMLRIAQVYALRGWKKEALPMLRRVLAHPELDSTLVTEGKDLLFQLEGNL